MNTSNSEEGVRQDPFSTLKTFQTFAPPRSNLPVQLTSFIGREKELATLGDLLRREDLRLITLVGSGGTGKTRLAIEVAGRLIKYFPGGVFLVSLASVMEPSLVLPTIAVTLGVTEEKDRPLVQSLRDYLRDKKILVLLDNFEQVIASALQIADLLSECPKVKILATSRAPLRIRGEYEFPVLPLELPDLNRLPASDDMLEFASIALFVERAHAIEPDFTVTDQNARTIAEICTRLDGLPLALELAAARIRTLAPDAMLSRLEHRLALLTTGAIDMPARQRTLRGAVAWSYDLLDSQDRQMFRRLSVFAGDFSLEAAGVICRTAANQETVALDGVTRLLERSLLRRHDVDGEFRFFMLETIREFAAEALATAGEAEMVRTKHADFFVELAARAESALKGPELGAWLVRLDRDYDNLRLALQWSLEQNQVERSLRLSSSLWRYWIIRGYLTEGRIWLEKVIERTGRSRTLEHAKVLRAAGLLAATQYDFPRALSRLNDSLAISRELGDKEGTAYVLNYLGRVTRDEGDFKKGIKLHEDSLAIFQDLGDKWAIATVLNNLGVATRNLGEYDRAFAYHQKSLQFFRDVGDKLYTARSLVNLGIILERQGAYDQAESLLRESLMLFQEVGEKVGIAEAIFLLGSVSRRRGDVTAGQRLFGEALARYRVLGVKEGIVTCLEEFAGCACTEGKNELAARLLGAAHAAREALNMPIPPAYRHDFERDLSDTRAALGTQRFAAEWARGQSMSLEEATLDVLEHFNMEL